MLMDIFVSVMTKITIHNLWYMLFCIVNWHLICTFYVFTICYSPQAEKFSWYLLMVTVFFGLGQQENPAPARELLQK